ncbi:TetR/AcrR family transcriptional regulator [Streptomyces flaveolus]|uniref:TetR/AcrR family transcriptional regulator n=1 Tax=Streptomyces flaveolus TaxID=67297 RepID=UPI0034392CCD
MAPETAAKRTGHALRRNIVLAAAGLLEDKDLEALSTRAVAARTGVPTLSVFRLFGDKEGLLEEAAEHGFQRYLGAEAGLLTDADPVQMLREQCLVGAVQPGIGRHHPVPCLGQQPEHRRHVPSLPDTYRQSRVFRPRASAPTGRPDPSRTTAVFARL